MVIAAVLAGRFYRQSVSTHYREHGRVDTRVSNSVRGVCLVLGQIPALCGVPEGNLPGLTHPSPGRNAIRESAPSALTDSFSVPFSQRFFHARTLIRLHSQQTWAATQ